MNAVFRNRPVPSLNQVGSLNIGKSKHIGGIRPVWRSRVATGGTAAFMTAKLQQQTARTASTGCGTPSHSTASGLLTHINNTYSSGQLPDLGCNSQKHPNVPPAPSCIAQLEDAYHAEYHNTPEQLCKALLRLLYTDLVALAWQRACEEEQRAEAALRGFDEISRRRQEKGIPKSTPHQIKLSADVLRLVLPEATPHQLSSRKFVPVSKVFTNPAGQAGLVTSTPQPAVMQAGLQAACGARQAAASQLTHVLLEQLQYQPAAGGSSNTSSCSSSSSGTSSSSTNSSGSSSSSSSSSSNGSHASRYQGSSRDSNSSSLTQPLWTAIPDKLLLFCMALMHKAGLTTYYGQYTVQQPHGEAASACAAAAELEGQLSSAVVQNMLRFGTGVGAGLAAAAGQLGLMDSRLAEAAARVWEAGSLHQLNARWMRVVSRVQPHVVLSLLRRLQCMPHGIRTAHTSWQEMTRAQCGTSRRSAEHESELHSPEALAALQCAAAEESLAEGAAAWQPVPWLSTCTGDGRGGWGVLTAVGADD